jgi:hypothetical protein
MIFEKASTEFFFEVESKSDSNESGRFLHELQI